MDLYILIGMAFVALAATIRIFPGPLTNITKARLRREGATSFDDEYIRSRVFRDSYLLAALGGIIILLGWRA